MSSRNLSGGVGVLVLVLLGVTCPGDLFAQQLHAFLVADTDSNLGPSVLADLDNLEQTLRDGLPPGSLRVYRRTGTQVTADNITRQLFALPIQPSDAVLLYYSGHGGFDPAGGHYFALTHGPSLLRSRAEEAITQPVTPRFWAIISDCCANFAPVDQVGAPAPVNQTRLLTHLFLRTSGRADFTSSMPGQVSIGVRSGGMFTMSFCDVLRSNFNNQLNWDEIFRQTRQRTNQASLPLLDQDDTVPIVRGVRQRTQIPYSFKPMYGQDVNGRRLSAYTQDLRITGVEPDSPASQAGLREGMRIEFVNGIALQDDNHFRTAIGFSPRQAMIGIVENGVGRTVEVELAY